ncbi:MAG: hypothetical protein OEY87_04455 [Gammaproteobacteria bacterium]|nr:hypothetical protein [Gammaproteobacteria bacterium]MDH5735356.1 hypothetical protein [Gammaproteobacteria bacterium]
MTCICYRKGYKYQLHDDYGININIFPETSIITRFIDLTSDGNLIIKAGYAWDGPSGPTIDTKNFMRGSLVHDALYQLMREQKISQHHKDFADRLLKTMCRDDGMSWLRAQMVYQGVKHFGKPATDPANKKRDHAAPKGCICEHDEDV